VSIERKKRVGGIVNIVACSAQKESMPLFALYLRFTALLLEMNKKV